MKALQDLHFAKLNGSKILWKGTPPNPIQDGPFWGCSRAKNALSKICHTYPTLMKLGTVTAYLKKIQKTHKSRDKPLEFCLRQHFSPEISNFCYIRKY